MEDLAGFHFDTFASNVLRNRFIPTPPPHRNQSSPKSTDFIKQGLGQLRTLYSNGLKPNHAILDLGCGIGRLALPATQFLSDEGSYFGLDINLSAIAWCFENITQRYPNFQFSLLAAENINYGHQHEYGKNKLTDLELPIPAERRFDVICAFSLFTHLLDFEMDYYMKRLRTLLKDDGVVVTTWFLITPESVKGIESGTTRWNFDLAGTGPHYLLKDSTKSHAIAYNFDSLVETAAEHGLKLRRRPWLAGWDKGQVGQDIVVFEAA